ncbi:hypothetical protein NQD34_014371, partial [Periophthalmus magnuspinnatus]
ETGLLIPQEVCKRHARVTPNPSQRTQRRLHTHTHSLDTLGTHTHTHAHTRAAQARAPGALTMGGSRRKSVGNERCSRKKKSWR